MNDLPDEDLYDEDVYQRAPTKTGLAAWGVRLGLGAALLCFVGLLAAGAWSLLSDKPTTKRQVVQVSLLKPPPPPPPPEQKPPEPEVKQEVKVPEPEQPKQEEQAPPPGEQLALDADASGSGDSFGLGAKKGGTDITKIGGPSGGGSDRAWFAGQVQSYLQTELSRNERLRHANYKVVIWLWFTADGHIERFEVRDSTGNEELDQYLKLALDQAPAMKRAPPTDMPQPVKLRVTSAGAG